jgi:hypothetical protein
VSRKLNLIVQLKRMGLMETLSGAIVLLAAAVVFGASIIGHGLAISSGREPGGMPTAGVFVAIVVGLIGFYLLVLGTLGDRTKGSR